MMWVQLFTAADAFRYPEWVWPGRSLFLKQENTEFCEPSRMHDIGGRKAVNHFRSYRGALQLLLVFIFSSADSHPLAVAERLGRPEQWRAICTHPRILSIRPEPSAASDTYRAPCGR